MGEQAHREAAPLAIRAIFAAWLFSMAVAFLVISVYAAGHDRPQAPPSAEMPRK